MVVKTFRIFLVMAVALMAGWPASAQSTTGTITGRALDTSGGVLPGVNVSISSPAMIGGAREAVTDALGTFRFTQVPPGIYEVKFALPSFRVLTVGAVSVNAGATATVNGPLQLETLAESITVTSQTPTIDLQSTTVGVNWSEEQMENLPYGRGIRGLARLVPGLSPTQFDVGGNTVGGSTTTGARSYGRTGGELIKFDGVVWDQFFGDYNTYEQVQVSAAARSDASTRSSPNSSPAASWASDTPSLKTSTVSPGTSCTSACAYGANSSRPTTGPPSSRRRTPEGPTTKGGLCPALV